MRQFVVISARTLMCSMFLLFLIGCNPIGPDYSEDLDVTLTTFDEDYAFDAKSTYAMPDKIVIDVDIDRNGDTTYVYMKDRFADQIFDRLESNMSSYGWTKVDIDDNPDMLLMPAGMSSTSYYYTWWYDWWYDDWYPGWWGWYYPSFFTVGSYTTGTMFLVLTDPNASDDTPINSSGVAWISITNGVLTYSDDLDRALFAIDQSFEQSGYLNIN